MLAAGLVELLAVFAAHGWARAGHAALALACIVIGVIAFIHPGNTFRALAAVMSFYLIVKGTADVILSLAFRDVELWWLRLITGLIEVVIGFWAAGYWVSTVGLDEDRVRNSIREQEELERRQGEFDFEEPLRPRRGLPHVPAPEGGHRTEPAPSGGPS